MPESAERRAGVAAARKIVLKKLGVTERGCARKVQPTVMVAARKLYSRLTPAEAAAIAQGTVPEWWSAALVRQVWNGGDVDAPPQPMELPVEMEGEEAVVRKPDHASPAIHRAALWKGEGGGQQRDSEGMEEREKVELPVLLYSPSSPATEPCTPLQARPGTEPYKPLQARQHDLASPGSHQYRFTLDGFEKDHRKQVMEIAKGLRAQQGSQEPLHHFKQMALWRLWTEADQDVRNLYLNRQRSRGAVQCDMC